MGVAESGGDCGGRGRARSGVEAGVGSKKEVGRSVEDWWAGREGMR